MYEILALIGAGGMGEVYRARDTRLSRDVALKILPDQFAADADRVARRPERLDAAAHLRRRLGLRVERFGVALRIRREPLERGARHAADARGELVGRWAGRSP
ncbi:MAG: hypothetical protein FJW14_02545 [Acidimicrobiia bacterium]|nr:hypothetical protein [Acidimicrobiia bacterium]